MSTAQQINLTVKPKHTNETQLKYYNYLARNLKTIVFISIFYISGIRIFFAKIIPDIIGNSKEEIKFVRK